MTPTEREAAERPSLSEALRWARNESRPPNFVDSGEPRRQRQFLAVLVEALTPSASATEAAERCTDRYTIQTGFDIDAAEERSARELLNADIASAITTAMAELREEIAKLRRYQQEDAEIARDLIAEREAAEAKRAERDAEIERLTKLVETFEKNANDWKERSFEKSRDWSEAHARANSLSARIAVLEEALRQIAAFDDVSAQRHLERTGSFGLFDEPGSVKIARTALSETETGEG